MKNTLKLLSAVLIGIAFVYSVDAARSYRQQDVPVDQNGNALTDPAFEAKKYVSITTTTETSICSGSCMLYDVIATSGSGNFDLYDSTTVNPATATQGHVILNDAGFPLLAQGVPFASLSDGSRAFPISCEHGLAAKLSSVSLGESIIVIYKDMD